MAYDLGSLGDRLLQRRMLRMWERAAQQAGSLDAARLKGLRQRARQLRRRLDEVLVAADRRRAELPDDTVPTPLHCDWAHRPDLWRAPVLPAGRAAAETRTALSGQVTLHHDCTMPELAYRQIRNLGEDDLAFYGLRVEVYRFDGTFLSLAIDLPEQAARGLQRRHLIRLEAAIETERPLEIFARLNVRHGPNTEQIVRELALQEGTAAVDFDLAYTKLNEKRVEKVWLDLIFEGPQMNAVLLRDVTLSRRPRAEF